MNSEAINAKTHSVIANTPPQLARCAGASVRLISRPGRAGRTGQLVKGNQLDAVVQIHVAGTLYPVDLLRLPCPSVGVLAELAGMRDVAGDEEHWSGRDRLDVVEGIEVHEFDQAAEERLGCQFGLVTLWRIGAARGAVEVEELTLDGGRVSIEVVHGAGHEHRRPALEFGQTLICRGLDHRLALLQRLATVQPLPCRRTHVVHADRGDGLDAWVDLGGTDYKAAAATDAQAANAVRVDKGLRAQEIHGRTDVVRIDFRRHQVSRCAATLAPEGKIDRQRDEALLGQLLRVELGTLLLHCAHRVANDHCGGAAAVGQALRAVKRTHHLHLVLVVEAHALPLDRGAAVEVVGSMGRGRHRCVSGHGRSWNVEAGEQRQ